MVGNEVLEGRTGTLIVEDWGTIPYKQAWDLQKQYQKRLMDRKLAIRNGQKTEPPFHYLIFCEHPHVYTLGRNGSASHLLVTEAFCRARGIDYYEIDRGGDITYHGYGQLVVYPILDLECFKPDLHWYIRQLEEVIIRVLSEYGIEGDRYPGYTGVWIDPGKPSERKICAIGIRCSRWVTMHGLAFNVNTDLSYFGYIIPCGIQGKGVTSLQKELGKQINLAEVKEKFLKHFLNIFNINRYAC